MAIDIDGLAILRAITATPELFPNAATEINNFVQKYMSGQLKPAKITLETPPSRLPSGVIGARLAAYSCGGSTVLAVRPHRVPF